MKIVSLPGTRLAFTLLAATTYLSGLPSLPHSSQKTPEIPSSSGYHTRGETPRGSSAAAPGRELEARLLNQTLKEVRHGQLGEAVATLQRLVILNPGEPGYKQLLSVAKRQLEREGWYRFQESYGAGGREAGDSQGAAAVASQAQPGPSAQALDDLLLLRLRLATWMSHRPAPIIEDEPR